jgi:hypothetical protein
MRGAEPGARVAMTPIFEGTLKRETGDGTCRR